MKKTFFAICALLLLSSLLLCSCERDFNADLGAVTTAASTSATTEPYYSKPASSASATKKDPPKQEDIDLSDANIEDFEETDEQTNYVVISVEGYGDILIRLFPEVAPITVNNFKTLVANKFYDGLIFHRVIENFMIQGGGYTTLGQEVPSPTIKGEFASNGFENNLLHVEGVISMARTNVPDSASSQFFIMHKTAPHLDGQYAAFGYAADGRDVVDAIAKCSTNHNDMPVPSVVISSVRFVKEKVIVAAPQTID